MLKRLAFFLLWIPLGIVVIILAVANRQPVTLVVPPVGPDGPFLSATVPMFVLVFVALLIGLLIGSMATWFRQGRYRKTAQERKVEATKATFEAQKQKERADALALEKLPEGQSRSNLAIPAPRAA